MTGNLQADGVQSRQTLFVRYCLRVCKTSLLQCAAGQCFQIGVDEAVQLAVHHGVDVAGLIAGTVVLYQLVGHKHVRTDLAAPLDLELYTLDVGDLLGMGLHLKLHQLGAQHPHTGVPVLKLAALGLTGNHNAGGLVDQADSGRGLVDVLDRKSVV